MCIINFNKIMKAVLTPAAQPCRYPRPTLGANLMFWFRLSLATKAPCGHPSPRRRAEENEKKEAETGGSG